MWEVIFIGGFFAGTLATLGVLALIDLRWSKRKKEKISTGHSLDTLRYAKTQDKG